MLGNRPPQRRLREARPTATTLPVWLQRAGYDTAHIGKYLNGYGDATPATRSRRAGRTGTARSTPPPTGCAATALNENGVVRPVRPPARGEPERSTRPTSTPTRRSTLIRAARAGERPFFLGVAFLAPHARGARAGARRRRRCAPAPRHRGRLASEPLPRRRLRRGRRVATSPRSLAPGLRAPAPAQIAQIAPGLPRRGSSRCWPSTRRWRRSSTRCATTGELDDTLIVFTSDNGFFHGEHRVPNGKYLAYEPSVRVPLLMRGPGSRAAATSRELVANIDLAPTILDAAGARAAAHPRRALAAALRRRPSRRSDRAILLETGQTVDSGDLDQDGGPGVTRPALRRIPTYRAVRTERFKYVEHSTGDRELYDLRRDPDELRSVHADPDYARTLAALRRELVRLRRCKGSACRREARRIPGPARRRGGWAAASGAARARRAGPRTAAAA